MALSAFTRLIVLLLFNCLVLVRHFKQVYQDVAVDVVDVDVVLYDAVVVVGVGVVFELTHHLRKPINTSSTNQSLIVDEQVKRVDYLLGVRIF